MTYVFQHRMAAARDWTPVNLIAGSVSSSRMVYGTVVVINHTPTQVSLAHGHSQRALHQIATYGSSGVFASVSQQALSKDIVATNVDDVLHNLGSPADHVLSSCSG